MTLGLREDLKSKRFIVTADVIQPKGTALYKKLQALEILKGKVDAINAVDMPSGIMRLSALATCVKLKEMGFEPILQLVGRDRNRISIQSELLGAYVLEIRNVLCLTGDDVNRSDNPNTKGVFDLDSLGILEAARQLETGFDLGGNRLDGTPEFCLGAALDPGAKNQEDEVKKACLKAEAGAKFFQTQPVFEIEPFIKFLKKVDHLGVPILGGVFILKSAASAHFLNKNIPGINVPDSVLSELEKGDAESKSINITIRLIRDIVKVCAGVHIMMTTPWHHWIPHILDEVGI